jgi:hypothetical protein
MQTAEHLIELQTVPMFMEYTMGVRHKKHGKNSRSGIPREIPHNAGPHIPCGVWVNEFQHGFFAWNNRHKDTPQTAFFKLLGSSSNAKHMVNCGTVGYFLSLFTFISLTHLSLALGLQ